MLDVRRSDARYYLFPEEPDLLLVHPQEGAENELRDASAIDAPLEPDRTLLRRSYHRDR